jgi:D-alanyl-D-alanine carboxypeptidase
MTALRNNEMDYAVAKTTRFFHTTGFLICVLVFLFATHVEARPRPRAPAENPRYAMLIMDAQSGKILEQQNADKPLAPASLTKIMTLFMTFEAVEQGRLKMSDYLVVSQNAMRQQPSKLGLRSGEKITVDQAVHILVTRSANDVAMALAETVGGSEKNFANMMTRRAHSLGMRNSYFYNPHGLPNPGQKSSARDMALLARATMQYFPKYYPIFSTIRFKYKGQTIETHNNLMRRFKGMDGIKTGYTVASGFNLVASAVRNNRRVIVVVFGGRSAVTRDNHVADLMNRGLAQMLKAGGSTQVASTPPAAVARKAAPVTPPTIVTKTIVNTSNTTVPSATTTPPQAIANTSQTTIETRTPTATADRAGWAPDGGHVRALQSPRTAPAPAATNYAPQRTASVAEDKSWGIQVGAFSSQSMGQQSVQAALARLRTASIQGQPTVVPSQTAQGMIYRARITGLSAQSAAKACQMLSDCMAFAAR